MKLPDHDERHFRISRDDRTVILERMAEKHPNVIERCKENFAYKDQLDREKNVMAMRMPTKDLENKTKTKTKSREQDWGQER